MAIHVFGVTNDDNLWHSIVPDQDDFGDVDGAGGTGRPWRKGAAPSAAQDSACAADGSPSGEGFRPLLRLEGRHDNRERGGRKHCCAETLTRDC